MPLPRAALPTRLDIPYSWPYPQNAEKWISSGGPIYLASVMQYLTTENLSLPICRLQPHKADDQPLLHSAGHQE